MKIAAVVGSLRKDSFNLKIGEFIQKRYKHDFEVDILDLQEIPFYNQDIENTPPEPVKNFVGRISAADLVLWITPEYNGSIPGVLKNVIDWLSRGERVMTGKPSWIIGATPGKLGTVKAQLHLREILFSISSPVLRNEVYIGEVHQKIDEYGDLLDETTIQFLDSVVSDVKTWVEKL